MLFPLRQAAWALGNIAADSPEAAKKLECFGAIPALAALMWQGEDRLNPQGGPTCAATQAAWVLTNLARWLQTKVSCWVPL
jgi:hypothetical protein